MDKWKSNQTFGISDWLADPNSGYADKQYSSDPAVAVMLLPLLSGRGYKCALESLIEGNVGYLFQITKGRYRFCTLQPTISEAISQATLKLISDISEGAV